MVFAEREFQIQLQFVIGRCLRGVWEAEEEAESQKAAVNTYAVVRGWTPSALLPPKIETKIHLVLSFSRFTE